MRRKDFEKDASAVMRPCCCGGIIPIVRNGTFDHQNDCEFCTTMVLRRVKRYDKAKSLYRWLMGAHGLGGARAWLRSMRPIYLI
jgi:hypothetical protein